MTIKFQAAVISGLNEMDKRWYDQISAVESELKRPKEDDADIFSAIYSCEGPMDVGEKCMRQEQTKENSSD